MSGNRGCWKKYTQWYIWMPSMFKKNPEIQALEFRLNQLIRTITESTNKTFFLKLNDKNTDTKNGRLMGVEPTTS